MKRCILIVGTLFCLGIFAISSGCLKSQEEAANLSKEQSRINALSSMYGGFISKNRGQSPPNEQLFKQYVRTRIAKRQSDAKPLGAEEIFVSERDQKPYVILYGRAATSGPRDGPAGMPVVIYEQDGVDGRRYVASSMGAVEEVDETRFQQLVPMRR